MSKTKCAFVHGMTGSDFAKYYNEINSNPHFNIRASNVFQVGPTNVADIRVFDGFIFYEDLTPTQKPQPPK